MSTVRFQIAVSLDGYAAGPDQSEDNPLGVGGRRRISAGVGRGARPDRVEG